MADSGDSVSEIKRELPTDHVDYWKRAYEKLEDESKESKEAIDRLFATIDQESHAFIERIQQDPSLDENDSVRKLFKMDLDIEKRVAIWNLSQKHKKVWKFPRKHEKVDDRTKGALREIANTDRGECQPSVPPQIRLLQICKERQRLSEADETQIEFLGSKFTLNELWKKTIVALEKSKGIGDVATSANPTASLAWSVFKVILEVPVKDAKQTGAMLIGMEKTLTVMNRATVHEQRVRLICKKRPSKECKDIEDSLVAIYCRLLGFLTSTSLLQSMNLFRRVWQAIWNADAIINFEKDITELEMEFERNARAFHDLLLQGSMDIANAWIEDLKHKRREKVLAWLSGEPYLDLHRKAKQGRGKNTGNWIFKRREYQTWNESHEPRLLWICGIPGAGKTKLITSIVDNHRRRQRQFQIRKLSTNEDESEDDESEDDVLSLDGPADGNSSNNDSSDNIVMEDVDVNESDSGSFQKTQLAFFYCRKGIDSSTLSRWVLGSLIRQLADNYYPLPQEVLKRFNKMAGPASKSREMSKKLYVELLKCMMPSDTETTLILDALDECVLGDDKTDSKDRRGPVDEVNVLLDVFQKLLDSNHRVKIVVSSQQNVTINAHMAAQDKKVLELVISATDNKADILKLARTRIREEKESKESRTRKKPLVSAELEEDIVSVFTKKSGGMFQWADYHIKYLLDLDSESDIRRALPGLPRKLEKAYEETFKRIDNDKTPRKKVALQVTQWLLANDGSCKKGVILAAISQSLEDKPTEELEYDESVVIKACCNLVAMQGVVFRFSHLSVQEYCVNHRQEKSNCHLHVTNMCLWMMSNYDSPVIDSAIQLSKPSAETTALDLWDYAYQNWYHQFRLCTDFQQEGLKKLLKSFIGEGHPPIGCTHWLVRLATDAVRFGLSLEFVNGPQAWTSMAWRMLGRERRDGEFGHLHQLLRALIAGLLNKIRHIFLQYLQDGNWPSEGEEINRLLSKTLSDDPYVHGKFCEGSSQRAHWTTHIKRLLGSEHDSNLDGVKEHHLLQIRDMWILAQLVEDAPKECWQPPSLSHTHYFTERRQYLRRISDAIFVQSSREKCNEKLLKLVPEIQRKGSNTNIAQFHDELDRLRLTLLATRRRERPSQDWEMADDVLALIVPMEDHTNGKYVHLLTAVNKRQLSVSLLQPPAYRQKDFYAILLSHGADANFVADHHSQSSQCGTPLIAAAAATDLDTESVAWLLSHGAGVNLEAKTGVYKTALIAACANDRLGVAKQLLERGARILPGPHQSQETNALHQAVKSSSVALVRHLWKRLPDSNHSQGPTNVVEATKKELLGSGQTSLAKGLILHLLSGNDDGVARGALEEVHSLFRAGNYATDLRQRATDLSKWLGYLNPDRPMVNGFIIIIEHCARLMDWNDVSEIWTNYLDLLDKYVELDEQKRVLMADELETNGKFMLRRSNSAKTDKYGTLELSDEDEDEADDDNTEGTDEENASDA